MASGNELDVLPGQINHPISEHCDVDNRLPFAVEKVCEQDGVVAVLETANDGGSQRFFPVEPKSFREADLTDTQVEALILKYLIARGDATGRAVAGQLRLPFRLLEETMYRLKGDQLLVHKNSAPMNDYVYQITELGRERARRYVASCSYFGAAPVALSDYVASVRAQSLEHQNPSEACLKNAFRGLLVNQHMLNRLGPAINSGSGLFLYGNSGNGKTSIGERLTMAFDSTIWIPRVIGIDGEIIRVFDPIHHQEVALEPSDATLDTHKVDRRWVRIHRPTIIVGGELTMSMLEVTPNSLAGINEAPLQLKANCGTLLIDDFGRQRMSVDELLNRWIVPLEKRYDFLNLSNGRTIQVPFDELIIFATNLEPADLVDEAFLRRIPYKIEVPDPCVEEFVELFRLQCPKFGFKFDRESVNYLIEKHYRSGNRPFRCCHPRDLLMHIVNLCHFQRVEPVLKPEYFDVAVENYFSVMSQR